MTITEGVEYAQYKNALKIEFTAKGARKRRGYYVTYKPFLVVVRAQHAIDPDSMMGPSVPGGPGVELSQSRYSCFDKRWESDFMSLLAEKKIPILFQVDNDYNTLSGRKTAA